MKATYVYIIAVTGDQSLFNEDSGGSVKGKTEPLTELLNKTQGITVFRHSFVDAESDDQAYSIGAKLYPTQQIAQIAHDSGFIRWSFNDYVIPINPTGHE